MEWVLRSPQIHNTFSNLGFPLPDGGYHINENCNSALESIFHNLITEDKHLRTYRRSISFGQNINKDLVPLLINTKDGKTIELLIKIFVNLTIPVECLLSLDSVSRTDIGRHTIFEINNLLSSTKIALTDHRVTKVIIEFLKKNSENEQKGKLSPEQCTNISNSLLILRNILHIPEDVNCHSPTYSGPPHTIQNQLLWNLFSQSIDKVLIKLMTIPDAINWGVTMVQLIALLYKDQHVTTLHKLLNMWLEASLSESSEDNESNTSPPNRGSDDSSPMLTSDQTSDSSDTGASGKCNGEPNSVNNGWDDSSRNSGSEKQNFQSQNTNNMPNDSCESDRSNSVDNRNSSCNKENNYMKEGTNTNNVMKNNEKKTVISENSDCGYGTQIENQESISTSSNEDELPAKKPVHQKPHTTKQRINNKSRPSVTLQERKRKKIVKRGKANIINVQGLSHTTPTDDDISNVLKEFTVDFLLKGYNSLVRTLHLQILTNVELEIDTSHFFWLVTYFLKFATQIELDLEHVCCVLSFEIVSYLTAEGVNLCEQFELAIKLDGNDLKPSIRRLHLVVTAIREFVQAIEVYKKSAHICNNDKHELDKLQVKMCETDELRSLLVLLLRYYNPKYHSKQYLQDLVVTNHILLMFMDNVMKLPGYKGTGTMVDHIRQFCSIEIMYQYGLLLEDYEGNGEFVNDCIFTMMHHVGGELESLISLFQPKILKIFTLIFKSEFEICDDWSDLIEYVINTFIKKPYKLQSSVQVRLDAEMFENDTRLKELLESTDNTEKFMPEKLLLQEEKLVQPNNSNGWTEDELSSLSWNYLQCNDLPDVIAEIVKMFKDDGVIKTRESVVKELYNQFIINKEQFNKLSKRESEKPAKNIVQEIKETRENEIGKLCEQLIQDGKSEFLDWVQNVLLECCSAKIYLEKKTSETLCFATFPKNGQPFEHFTQKPKDLPLVSPVSYHSLLLSHSVPLVPWNDQQASICKDLKFLQLLHKLGFHMPVDTGKVFIRIPHFWTPDFLYEVAGKISPIDISKLKFCLKDISQSSILYSAQTSSLILPELSKTNVLPPIPDNFYQIHNKKQNLLASIVNFTPMPGSFTTADDNVNKPNWLKVVQKSQEYKITLDLGKSIIVEDEDEAMKLQEESVHVSLEAAPPVGISTILSGQQQPAGFTIGQPDSDCCNNSVCETASVASDLTRMYVSDEDEKPEPLQRAGRAPLVAAPDPLDAADTHSSSDLGSFVAGKRPRVQFLPHFKTYCGS
ncbi:protein timeless [Maniola hyperantus]|uniref:protein timeless n=1 Tax=Aphantopus hyperantus TaxID=2795564 RepID=UPI00156A559F|nr:protein timeless [Maniola hyperantus]